MTTTTQPTPDELKAANYGARMGQVIAGRLVRGTGGRFSASGGAPAPAAKPARPPRNKRKARAKQSPAERQQQRDQAKAEKLAKNLADAGAALGDADAPLSQKGLEALAAFASGGELSAEQAQQLAALGVVTIGADGTPRLSADGRKVVNAAKRGDVRGVVDAAFAAGEKVGVGAAGEALAEKPKKSGGGGGGGGKAPPQTDEEKAKAKADAKTKTLRDTAEQVGLGAALADALATAARGAGTIAPEQGAALAELGLAEDDGSGGFITTDAGRRALGALERGDTAGYRAALQDVRGAQQRASDREAAATQRDQERAQAAQEREAAAAQRKQEQTAAAAQREAERAANTPEARQAANRQQVAQQMAAQDRGLSGPALSAFTAFADGGDADPATLGQIADGTGLLERDAAGDYRLSADGKRFATALDKGDTRAALDALSRSLDRLRAAQQPPEGDATAMDTTAPAAKGFFSDNDHPGAMLAFLLDAPTRAALLDAAEMADDEQAIADHITLIYLTPEARQLDAAKNALVGELARLASGTPPLQATTNGYGRFTGEGEDGDALYVNVDGPQLPGLRQRLADIVQMCGVAYVNNHGFTPHVTLSYLDPDASTPDLDIPRLPLTFDRVALVWAGETLTFPLLGLVSREGEGEGDHDDASEGEGAAPMALDDTMIYPGGAVKSLDGGRVGGYLVVFGDPANTDLAGDFFTPATDFGFAPGERIKTTVWFNHRLPLPMKARNGQPLVVKERIGEGWLSQDAQGVFIDAVLDNRKQYERMLAAMGWSSGTAAHLVDREPVKGGTATRITRWPLGLDASLTPTPAEPRTRAIPLKSYTPPELALQADPEAGDPAAVGAAQKGAPHIRSSSRKEFPMDRDELKAMLGELLTEQTTSIEAKMAQRDAAIDARLKAFEDAPALKNSGFISMDGGSADKNVKSFADWLLAVKRRDTKRLTTVYKSAWTVFDGDGVAVKDMSEGSGPAGGYAVPVEYEPMLQRISAEAAIIEPRARKITMGSATKLVPMLKQTANPSTADGGSAFFGGLVFTWNPEGADISTDKSDPLWDMVELIARKLTGLTVSSNELIEDAPSMESELTQLFGEGLAHAKDFFYLRGNGVGKPLGVLNAPCRYQLTRKASGNNVEIEDVSGLMARMLPSSMSKAIWVLHPLTIADIIQLKIGDTPVFQPDAKGPIAGTLLGRPLAFSEYCPAPGSAGDIGLYDFGAYAVGQRRGITIASSEHARFDEDQTTWRITYRGDGQPLLDSTVKLADGSNTEVSPFAILN